MKNPFKQSESDFQKQVIEYAHLLGYKVAHFRSVCVKRKNGTESWQTPVQADGEGFPDLIIIRERDGRMVVAELKSNVGKLSKKQTVWISLFRSGGTEAYVWRPSDWNEIEKVLRG